MSHCVTFLETDHFSLTYIMAFALADATTFTNIYSTIQSFLVW